MPQLLHLQRALARWVTVWLVGVAGGFLHGQQALVIYGDGLANGFQDWSWAPDNLANTTPVHSGARSISVTAAAWQGFYLHHEALDTHLYASLGLWANGGTGGQRLQLQAVVGGTAQAPYVLPALAANTWKQFVVPLSALSAADRTNFEGFWLQLRNDGAGGTFYLDDLGLAARPPPARVRVRVEAGQEVRVVDARLFGVNTAVWDGQLDTAATLSALQAADLQALRFPGGSLSDEYHWARNVTDHNTWTWATSFDQFAAVATNLGARVFVTANYGTGSPAEAAAWVRYANITHQYGCRFWEIGNEVYGGWETDSNTPPHDPVTYAQRFRDYVQAMKAVDPTIKAGVVVVPGEDSFTNAAAAFVLNPRTGERHAGWTPVVLATLRSLGVSPDFAIHHRYPQNPGQESDPWLLGSSASWAQDAATLRQELRDYLGPAGAGVELVCTENNSVSSGPGKQTTSLVNGLFLADSTGQILQTEFNALIWWDLRNGQDPTGDNDPTLYGWRLYGDYGLLPPAGAPYPTYYATTLLRYFARGGDQVVRAASDYPLLAAYAARRSNGALSLLVINKSPTATLAASVALSGYEPFSNAVAYSYGIAQDEAARTGLGATGLAQTTVSGVGVNFTSSFAPYSMTVLALAPAAPELSLVGPAGLTNTPIEVRVTSAAPMPWVIQASADLRAWTRLATNTDWASPWRWGPATNGPWRFYRAVWPP